MGVFAAFGKMLVILFSIALGFAANRLGYLNADTDRRITKLIINITMPCLILASVAGGNTLPDAGTLVSVLKASVAFYGLGLLFALVLPRLLGGPESQQGVWRYSCVFSNIAFIGYPVVSVLFGPEALFYAVVLNIPFDLLNYSVGPMMLGGRRGFSWTVLRSPCMVAAIVVLAATVFRIRIPAVIGEMLDFVGGATVPMALLMLGSVLAGMQVRQVFAAPRLWIFAVFRLLVMPAVLLLVLRPMGLDSTVMKVTVVEMATPAAVSGIMLCMEYDYDAKCMAQLIFVTTLISMVTIPLVTMLL